jgi:cytoskeletal protein RodZ
MGAYLRAARRRRRVSIERAAEDTRIRADFLMRMESDEFDFLSPAYVRGFLKSYARFLRVDPDPLLEEFDRTYGAGRLDTSQILALDRRQKSNQLREPRLRRSWSLAAVLATGVLLILAVIGVITGPDKPEPRRDTSVGTTESPSPTPTPTAGETVVPAATATPLPTDGTIAFTDGIDVKIVADSGRCWVQVLADGDDTPIYTSTLEVGDSATVAADEEMEIVLGYAAGVKLIINGVDIGSPGIEGPTVLHLPRDIEDLL